MNLIPPLGMVESKTLLNNVRRPTKTMKSFFHYSNALTLRTRACVLELTFPHVAGSNEFSFEP